MGYDIVRRDGKKSYVLNKIGKLIGKGFQWKATGVTNEDVRQRLAATGLNLTKQRLSDILRNPFYCGLIVHKALEGNVIEGIQEKAVSRELFLKVNGILSNHHQGYTVQSENDIIPLKRFLKCDECGSYLRGYKAYKNQKYYFKCNTPGCKCNKRADTLHEMFRELLAGFTLDVNEDYRQLIKMQVIATYNQFTQESLERGKMLEERMAEIDKKIKRLRERYANEEIDRDLYEEFTAKLIGERKATAEELGKMGNEVSNLDKCVDKIISYASNLATTWDLAAYAEKHNFNSYSFLKECPTTGKMTSVEPPV